MSKIIAPNKKNIFYVSLILIICMIFGFGLIATKDLLDENFPKYLFLTLRFGIGVLVLLLIRKLTHVPKIRRTEVRYGALIGVVLFIGFALQTTGLKYTTPANIGLFTGLSVIFVPIIMMITLRKFFSETNYRLNILFHWSCHNLKRIYNLVLDEHRRCANSYVRRSICFNVHFA